MTGVPAAERLARAALTYLAEPADIAAGIWLRTCGPESLIAGIRDGSVPAKVRVALSAEVAARAERPERTRATVRTAEAAADAAASAQRQGALLAGETGAGRSSPGQRGLRRPDGGNSSAWIGRAMRSWRARLSEIPADRDLADAERSGIRLVCPGDREWPTQLDALGDIRPYALWLRGNADLRLGCLRSVSMVGARAATAYGAHVAAELAAALTSRGWSVVSGGAYGIDGAAHRGCIAADGVTVAVLASGVDDPYPQGHRTLFDATSAQGVLVSEWPPGRNPTRHRFLVRNRVIAALSRGTVVVEARRRSGALSTANYARDLCRPLMAVPGPITSDTSAGCHRIMREWDAVVVTAVGEVLEQVAMVGEYVTAHGEASQPSPQLDPVTAAVLEAVPARGGAGPATVAVAAGVDLDTALSSLGMLAAGGFVLRGRLGWRLARGSA